MQSIHKILQQLQKLAVRIEEKTQACGGNSEAIEWYKSMKLTQQWLQSRHECSKFYNDAQGQRKRLFVKCLICEKFEFEAKKYSRNGVVPLARRVVLIQKRN